MTLSLGVLFAAPGGLGAQAAEGSGPLPSTQSTQNFADVEGRAHAGDAAAQSLLATMYRSGVGVRRDYVQAVAWYRKAAEQGDAKAEEGLGAMYQYGAGIERDPAQAIAWYRKAAEQGNADAANNLGSIYDAGTGVPQDSAQAMAWYEKAAAQDNANAEYNLATMYQKGRGVARDLSQAAAWFEKAAAHGVARAQNELGVMYRDGDGVPKDLKQGADWFQKAAKQGYALAQDNLGWAYQYGQGVPINDFQAMAWYQKAAVQGNSFAENSIGWMFQEGIGVPKDFSQAAVWYQKAAAQGNADSENNLGWLYQNGYGVPQDNAQAIAWYQKSAAQGNDTAPKHLAALNEKIAAAEQSPAASAPTAPGVGTAHEFTRIVQCDLQPTSTDGLAVFSATLPDNVEWFNYFYVRQGGGFLSRKSLGVSRIAEKSDFPGMFGKVYSLRLPAGNYQILFWRYHAFGSSETESPRNIQPLTFTVQADRAVYLGGFDPIGFERKQGIFHATVEDDWVLVRDDRTRDLPAFFNLCPAFDRNLLDISVMDTSPWVPQQKK
jgi:TPR repeat protein